MAQPILERILRASGMPGLLAFLSDQLAPTDLQSLLLAVYQARAARQTPARVLDQYQHNRFVRPASGDPRQRLALDQLALACAAPAFVALDLAPVCPLGTVAALGPVDQNKVVSTIRNTEVVSDCTNVLALECAVRRRAQRQAGEPEGQVRLCTSQRLLRAQNFSGPGQVAHFQIVALCTAGRAAPDYRLELAALTEQLACYLTFLAALPALGYPAPAVRVVFTDLPDPAFLARLPAEVIAPLAARFPAAHWEIEATRVTAAEYYTLARFHIYASLAGSADYELADGGFTTWTQQLLGDQKERLLISGIATERVCALVSGHGAGSPNAD